MDIASTKEVINAIADNTFVDGVKLNEAYPEIQEWLSVMETEATAKSEAFNLDKLRAPVAMRRKKFVEISSGEKVEITQPTTFVLQYDM